MHGGEAAGRALVNHPEVALISFTGSTTTGGAIGEAGARMHKRVSLEMGGKNAMIVMDDADLDLALDDVRCGAFGTTRTKSRLRFRFWRCRSHFTDPRGRRRTR